MPHMVCRAASPKLPSIRQVIAVDMRRVYAAAMDSTDAASPGLWQVVTILASLVSALVGAGGALLGVLLSNRHALRQQRQQIAHDAAERDRERHMQLRRDIYLPAADALSHMVSILAKVSDLRVQDSDIRSELEPCATALQRVQMVGSETALRAVAAAQRVSGAVYLELLEGRRVLRVKKEELERANAMTAQHFSELQAAIGLVQQTRVAGEQHPHTVTEAQERLALVDDQHRAAAAESETRRRDLMESHLRYMKHAAIRNSTLLDAAVPALVAIRSELGVPGDPRALEEEWEATKRAVHDAGSKIIEALRRQHGLAERE